ncbi:MAG: AAA family ATPase [Chitinophagaceae bacterium]|nr:AAA family ATPase [Chitinophagaceae bacterium]
MPFPITLNFQVQHLFNSQQITFTLNSGLTILVGPNGSGKTQVLKALKQHLQPYRQERKIRFVTAVRLASLEFYRSNSDGQSVYNDPNNANLGLSHMLTYRHQAETAIGDFQTLAVRPDIQIKIKERLSSLFNRKINLEWQNGQLKVSFISNTGASYPSVFEASGLLNLVALLSALYDDEVSTLLIDEPEISLHPQLQSFYYQEIMKIAGDPVNRKNKVIVLSTHSTEFIFLRRPNDICNLIFFNNAQHPPVQIQPTTPELQSRKLRSLLVRLGLNQKLAFFSYSPLLVEGPSDQTICTALETKLSIYLGASGCQIVPVTGKGQIPVVYKFFKLIGKKPVILTDVDSLADNLELVNSLNFNEQAEQKAVEMGAANVRTLASNIYNDYCNLIQTRWQDIAAKAEQTTIWIGRNLTKDVLIYKKRAGMVTILHANDTYFQEIPNSADWKRISTRIKALLGLLEIGGCFILTKGYIEDYYQFAQVNQGQDKAETAVEEMINIEDSPDVDLIEAAYSDIIRALKFAAQAPQIDESNYLAGTILSAVSPIIHQLTPGFTDERAKSIAHEMVGDRSSIFNFSVSQHGDTVQLSVDNKSVILDIEGFPLVFTPTSNPVEVVKDRIKRKK